MRVILKNNRLRRLGNILLTLKLKNNRLRRMGNTLHWYSKTTG